MKKIKLLLVALMGLMSATFVSCESSDDATGIVGTWTYTETYDDEEYAWKDVVNLIFSSNGDFTFEYHYSDYKNGELYDEGCDVNSGYYTYEDEWLTITYTAGEEAGYSESGKAVVDGNKLYLYDEDGDLSIIYTRK